FLFIFLLCAGTGEASAKTLVDAPHIRQMPELPRGCEVTSLAMLLESQGVNAPKMTLAKEVRKVPFKLNGLHGNPYDGFVGNMYT
ncbi:C39 family peptidase, partial [Escherichia coli]|nr:C39 family peptidase [Escherichia coli]